jgi:hypothetical protein
MKLGKNFRETVDNGLPLGVDRGQPLSRGASKGGIRKQAARLIRETQAPALNWAAPATVPVSSGVKAGARTAGATRSSGNAAPSPSSRYGRKPKRGAASSKSSGGR